MKPVPDLGSTTADRYRAFAEIEAPGQSPVYESWALRVAGDPIVLDLIDELPHAKRQVNLVFSAARALGAEAGHYDVFRTWLIEHWDELRELALVRSTQTNEAARCAVLLPLLASIPGPIALLEVGASAGLCLHLDRYSYRYGDREVHPVDGPSSVMLSPVVTGPVPVPERMPQIVWRAGLDLNPLDPGDPEDSRWLEALVWPEHDARRARLRAALDIARKNPVRIVRGDAIADLPALAAEAPRDATLVVVHSAVLAYFTLADRQKFVKLVSSMPVQWIANEGESVVPGVDTVPNLPSQFILTLNGRAHAFAGGHGQSLDWIG